MLISDYCVTAIIVGLSVLKFLLLRLFKKFLSILFIFRGDREGEKHQCVVASRMPLTEDPAHNPGMCPDWGWNQQPFGSQACAIEAFKK